MDVESLKKVFPSCAGAGAGDHEIKIPCSRSMSAASRQAAARLHPAFLHHTAHRTTGIFRPYKRIHYSFILKFHNNLQNSLLCALD